jgi:aryl-alcohol dehydrogenase
MFIEAAVLREQGSSFSLEIVECEPPRANEVFVRLVGTGICHTDIKMQHGYRPLPLPIVLGHEGAGIVEAVGSQVCKVKPGDHVVLTYNSCGLCLSCQSGYAAYCDQVVALSFGGKRPDGSSPLQKNGEVIYGYFFGQSSFATHAIATERNVVPVRRDAPLELLGPLGCAIQTGAGAVLNSLQVEMGASLAVFGVGSVGLSAVMGSVIAGCTTIIAVDVQPERLELARELGATHTIQVEETAELSQSIRAICPKGVAYAVETTAKPQVLRQAVMSLAIRGRCGLVGGAPAGVEVQLPMGHLLFGRSLQGIVQGDSVPDIFIPRLIDLYMQGRFPFDRLITFYSLSAINQACEDAQTGKAIKPVVRAD